MQSNKSAQAQKPGSHNPTHDQRHIAHQKLRWTPLVSYVSQSPDGSQKFLDLVNEGCFLLVTADNDNKSLSPYTIGPSAALPVIDGLPWFTRTLYGGLKMSNMTGSTTRPWNAPHSTMNSSA